MGKKAAKSAQSNQEAAIARYSQLANEQAAAAKPMQDFANQKTMAIAQGGKPAYSVSAPEINFMKRQFSNAGSQVRNMAAGGQKNRAFRDLALTQPGAIAGVFQRKVDEALQRLSQLGQQGVGNTLAATGGVSQGADSLAQLAAARGAAVSGAIGSIGGIAGMIAGGAFAKTPTPKTPLSGYAQAIH